MPESCDDERPEANAAKCEVLADRLRDLVSYMYRLFRLSCQEASRSHPIDVLTLHGEIPFTT